LKKLYDDVLQEKKIYANLAFRWAGVFSTKLSSQI